MLDCRIFRQLVKITTDTFFPFPVSLRLISKNNGFRDKESDLPSVAGGDRFNFQRTDLLRPKIFPQVPRRTKSGNTGAVGIKLKVKILRAFRVKFEKCFKGTVFIDRLKIILIICLILLYPKLKKTSIGHKKTWIIVQIKRRIMLLYTDNLSDIL